MNDMSTPIKAPGPDAVQTPASATSATANSNASRRPPRKSTLTQQQKNQKRQRATQEQLMTLEVEFNKNPTPTATVRERIAEDIQMTERSVQIWFQNRRAKIKLLAKKSIETGEDCDAIPDSMRTYLANQALESGKPLAREFLGRSPGHLTGFGANGMLLNPENQAGKIVIHHITCKSLSIGSWRRVGQNAMDLVVFYAPEKATMTYYINNDGAGYKIEYPFASIKNISLENGDMLEDAPGMPPRPCGLLVELNRPPNFFMDSAGTGGFHQCGDFTEDQQASSIMVHHLGGHPKPLGPQLSKLMSLDTFQNRHNPFDQQHLMAASAPVSPLMAPPRPSSQPNAHMPHPNLALFQDNNFTMQPPPRGHKRTRSRSVPAAIDFSQMPPMPSFHVQRPSTNMIDIDNIFAPVPQHHNHLGTPANLRIDTSTNFGTDYRQYPLSAATTNSPSEYASPGFYSSANYENIPATNYGQSYSLPFLSPMGEQPHSINPSVSPLSAFSHGDPVIADGSPPMGSMQRSPSADFLSISQDHQSAMSDDGLLLSEMYSKQNLNLPMHSPNPHPIDDSEMKFQMHEESSSEELDLHNMVSFSNFDHSSMSPERTVS